TNRGENASYNSFLADARVSWRATPSTLLQVGYRHDFRDSLFSNFVTYDRVYANAQQRLFRIWDLNLDVGYEYLQYSALPYAFRTSRPDAIQQYGGLVGQRFRNDHAVRIVFSTDVDVVRYLKVSAIYSLDLLSTPFFVQIRSDAVPDGLSYLTHTATLMLTVRY
ncbi:MAG: hypothetical protein FJ098_05575, partial [Deltaproteobacteria bacterium]|nr:hypothetical protein [Deltaproteobacteria bacterium]